MGEVTRRGFFEYLAAIPFVAKMLLPKVEEVVGEQINLKPALMTPPTVETGVQTCEVISSVNYTSFSTCQLFTTTISMEDYIKRCYDKTENELG